MIGISNPFAKPDSDKGYNVTSPEENLALDKLNFLDVIGASDPYDEDKMKDFIPFRFEILNHKDFFKSETIAFRAFISDIGDDYNASFNEVKYNGRPEKFYTYSSFERKIGLSFKIAAQTRHEMRPLYRKLNHLVSQTAPGWTANRMVTPFMKLTVGDWFRAIPGILNNVSLKWQTDYSWEIQADKDQDIDVIMLPHVLDVSISFTPIHSFLPDSALDASPFIGVDKFIEQAEIGEHKERQKGFSTHSGEEGNTDEPLTTNPNEDHGTALNLGP